MGGSNCQKSKDKSNYMWQEHFINAQVIWQLIIALAAENITIFVN